jgi:hypothetical protein
MKKPPALPVKKEEPLFKSSSAKHNAYDLKEKNTSSKAKAILQKKATLQDAVLLSEILKRPNWN